MFRAIDHIVVVVPDLEAAIAAYGDAGFTVVRGGRHNNIGTHNALIAFADGSYIELIAFLNPVPGHPWYRALQSRGGLVDFCMQTDDLESDVAALRAAGAAIGDPSPMTRDRPDGYRLSWVLAIPQPPFSGQVPFLIRDETPRDERVPRERSHRNGVTGLRRVTLAVENPGETSRYYARVLGRPAGPRRRPDLKASGSVFAVGPHEIELIAPRSERSPLADWLKARGPSPYSATLCAGASAPNPDANQALRSARINIE
jgi:catechol 2,3-dioxygenase-like lactoylglutathione lyase family enzyme